MSSLTRVAGLALSQAQPLITSQFAVSSVPSTAATAQKQGKESNTAVASLVLIECVIKSSPKNRLIRLAILSVASNYPDNKLADVMQ
jgi:hypothetical protein